MARFLESTKEINKAARKQRKPKQQKPKQQKPKQNTSANKPASNKPAAPKTGGNKNKAGGSQYSVKQDKQITSRQTQAPKNNSVNRNTRENTNRATQRYSTNVRNGSQYSVANSANRRATRNYKQQQNNRFERRKNELKDSNILKGTKAATNNDIRRLGGAQYKVDNSSRENEFGKKIADAERRAKLGLKGGTIEVLGSLANYIAENTDDKFGNRERDRYALQYATGQISEKELNQKYKELDDRWNSEKKTLQKAADDTANLKLYGTALKEEGRKGLTGINKTLYDGLSSIPYMAITRAAGPAWRLVTYMAGAGGDLADKKQMYENGEITDFERRKSSILSGGIETVTESAFGALTPLTNLPGAGTASKGLDDIILRGIDAATMNIRNGFLKNVAGSAMKLGAAGAEEAVEELAASVLEVPAENISYRNRMDRDYRANLGSNTSALDEQVDYFISKGLTREEAVRFILESVNSEETLDAIISDYVNSGLSEKNAKRQAKNLQEYMSAHLSGDKEAKQAAEDKLAKGIKAEFSWKDANEAMAAAFAATVMTGAGTSAFSTFNGMNIKNQFEKVAGTKSAAETITEAAIKKGLDGSLASRAQAMNEHAKSGKDLSYEQYAELGNAILAQTVSNSKKANIAIKSAKEIADSESFYVMPGAVKSENGEYRFGQKSIVADEDGKPSIGINPGGVTENKAQLTRAALNEIVNRIESESGKTLEDKDSFVEEMVALNCGYATPYTVDYLTEASPEYRSAYEEYFGQALPKDNEQMREFVYKQSAANLVESAKAETIDKIDTDKGFYDVQVANHLGEEGQQTLQAISDNIGVLDSMSYIQQSNQLIGAYEEGRSGASLDKVLELYSDVRGLDRASVEAMYQAGVADKARGSDTGSVVYDVSDKSKIRNSHRDTMLAFSRIFGVRIVVTDALTIEKANKIENKQSIEESDNVGAQINGMFYDNTIYINLNDDIRKPIGYTIMHELTHGIKQMFPEDYDTFAELFEERWKAKKNGKESFDEAIQGKIKTYADNNVSLSETDALEEIICDQMAEVLYDEQFMQNIAENHPSLAQSLLYAIQDVIRKIRQLFANYGGFRSEFNEATLSQLDMLKDAEALLVKAIQAAQDGRTQEILNEGSTESSENNGDVIPLSKRFDSTSSDIRFSIDSNGNELSSQQSEYFKDSKVRDEDGNLLVMHHGTKADFTVFDKNYIGGTGRFEGAGFNFTSFEGRAMSYDTSGEGKVFRTYLNIKNPLSDSERTITKSKLKKIVSGIAQREDIEGYDSIIFAVTAPYGKNIDEDYNRSLADTVDYLWRSCKTDADIYSQISTLGTNDEVVIDEFEKEGFDGLIWHDDGTISTVIAFEPEQIKSVDNKQPTLNPDIRFSIPSETIEALDSYEGNADTLPVAEEVVDKFLEKYKEKHPGAKFSISAEEADRFENEYRSLELWRLDEDESFDTQMEFYSKWQKGVANKDTFFYNTMCDWKSRKSRPKGKPDYVSRTRDGRVSSEYWYTDDGVVRGSNHWGKGVASCDWIVDGNRAQKYGLSKGGKVYAKASWGDFVFKTRSVVINGDNYLVNFDNTVGKGNVRADDDYEYTYNSYDRKWYNAYKPAPLSEVIPSKESVIQYSIDNPWDTSWFDGMLDDEEVNTRGDKNKSIAEISAEFTNIVIDNAKLTGGKVLDRKSIKKQIGELVKMTTKDTTYTAKEKREIADFLMDTAEQIWSIVGEKRPIKLKQEEIDRIINLLYEASDYVISNAQYINDTMLDEIIEFKKFFRGREVGVSAGARAELADDWDTIRKRNFGRVRFVSAEKYGVTNIADALIQTFPEAPEISLLYGREVEEALEIGDEATLVRILDDVLSNLSVVDDAIKSEYAEDFRVALSQDFARIVLNEGEAWESKMDRFKDRYEQRIKDMRARQKEAVRDLRSNYEKLLAEQNATFKKKLAETKAKSEERLQAEKDKQKAKEQKRKDSEQRKKIRNRIAEDYNWLAQRLVKPKKDDFKHIPSDFVESVANLLEIFDFQTERSLQLEEKRGYASNATKAMRELKDKISKYSSPDGGNVFVRNDALDVLVDECIGFLDGRALRELEDNELQKVSEMLRAVRHMVKTQNELFVANRKATVAEAGESIISESAKKMEKYGRRYDRTGISGKLSHLLNETMMTPGNFFDSLGGTMKALYKNLRNAQDDYIMKVKFLRDFYKDLLGGYYKKAKPGSAVEDWQTQTNEFILGDGTRLNMTVAQVMSLHCLSKRKQALGHIRGSGIVLSDVTLDKGVAKVIGSKIQNTASGCTMTYNDVMNVISSLTDEQKRIADAIQNLMNTTLKEWGNETSLRLFDMEFFTEENYFPISVEQSELATEIGKGTEIKGNRITSFGMTKPLTEHANNKIIIGDIFSIAADHCNKMALYSAYAPSLIDFNRVYNYKQRNEDGTTGYTVKGILKDAYSNKALKFIDNILDDINGQAQPRTDGLTAMINASLANYKKAAIGLNMRVLVQQPTAIMRSLYMINPKYFTPDCFVGLKSAREEMHEHCPISAWKAWGNYQNDYTKNFEDVMLNKDWSKFDAVTMGAYGWADDMTWAVIWNAVKKEVKQKNPDVEVGSEEYWNLCNERASEIYDETQVVDSVFHRSDAMRNPDKLAKLFTSFMAEPTRTYNMVRSSLVKAYRSHKDGDNKAAASELNKMLMVVILNAAAVSAAAAVVDAFRGKGDDDDDETWFETFYRNFGENFKDNVNMLHNIVYVKDVVSLFENAIDGKYFSPSNMVLDGWVKLAKGVGDYEKVLSGDKTFIEWISGDFGAGIGYVTGIPTATFIKDGKALWNRLSLPTFASDGAEEETPSLWDYENNPLEVTDGTWADNVLNFFGINLTPEERAERDFKRTLESVKNKTKNLSGAEKKEAVNKIVMEGYTSLVEDGDFAKLKQMRRIIEAAGGDVEAFDEKVTKRTASEYKKTIGVEADMAKQAEMRQYLLENGWTEAKISGEIVYKSNLAKDFKKACRELDIEKGTDVLTYLILAGITEADAYKLWENRNRGNFDTYSTGKYIAPTNGQITSGFGYRSSPTAGASSYHQGIDIAASRGSVVSAADGGRVVYAGYNGGYGNQIVIQHDDGTQTYYSHLDHISVRKGQSVSQKQYIGNVGSTGISTGPHLDFRVNVGGQFVDPLKYFSV